MDPKQKNWKHSLIKSYSITLNIIVKEGNLELTIKLLCTSLQYLY